ncbi:6445_t:CDS:10 [Acaulospora colombiana]|uniref:6445_t:CDS:1 n=1 Tax=Acaulospora colombiana TaxID=27376 RepID=A0ACA9K830_9GLOM|nr:6445_t:CDS:10 [Acaulospora colombiana]
MSEDIPFQDAVLELVKVVQTALYIIGDFPWDFVDGLLCDSTESALRKFNIETTTLEEFGKSVQIDRLRYLWRGKEAVESDWFHGGRELGKSFLRGAKTGGAIKEGVRGVTGSLSNLVDRGGSPIEKIVNLPSKSLSLPPNWSWRGRGKRKRSGIAGRRMRNSEGRKSRVDQSISNNFVNSKLLTVPQIEYESTDTEASAQPDMDAESVSSSEDETCDWQKRERSCSVGTYEKPTSSSICELRRSNSFATLEMARKQGVRELSSRRTIDMDIQTYMIYENLKQKEVSLKGLVERLESIVKEYDDQIEQLNNAYDIRYEKFKSTEMNGLAVLSKQKMVSKSINQIKDHSGKLNYEIGVLEDKLKEAEDLVNRFCLKVQVLDSKMTQSQRSIRVFYDLWNYIFDQLRVIAPRFYKKRTEGDDE